jgi:hypothetical protein
MITRKFSLACLVALFSSLLITSCDDTTEDTSYNIPENYEFENVDYSGQETRIAMLAELSAYAKTSNNGEVVSAAEMQAMFENSNAPFADEALNASSKNLKSKTFELDQELIESYFQKLETATQTAATTGSNGTPGLVSSNDGAKTYFFDENGYEYAQLIEKGLMGACFYYQTLGVYLTPAKIGETVDNTEVEEGKGTAMEHHWDEAFGYLSLPVNYPSSDESLNFWGKYIDGRESDLKSGTNLMSSFIKGRAAISADDMKTKAEATAEIYTEFELVAAATGIHYINSALGSYTDDALRNHTLSEAWAFINALQYNPNKTLSTSEVVEIRDMLGDNFYTVSRADLESAKVELATAFNLTEIADTL